MKTYADEAQLEKNFAPLGRKMARRALKAFFEKSKNHIDGCGCNELNIRSAPCQECLAKEVEAIMSDLIFKELSTPDSKFEMPKSQKGREQFEESSKDFIQGSLKRTFNNAFSSSSLGGEAMITSAPEAYEAGLQAGRDAVDSAAIGLDDHKDADKIIREEVDNIAPKVHALIQEYFEAGVQESIQIHLPARLSAEEPQDLPREYRAARYEKDHLTRAG